MAHEGGIVGLFGDGDTGHRYLDEYVGHIDGK